MPVGDGDEAPNREPREDGAADERADTDFLLRARDVDGVIVLLVRRLLRRGAHIRVAHDDERRADGFVWPLAPHVQAVSASAMTTREPA